MSWHPVGGEARLLSLYCNYLLLWILRKHGRQFIQCKETQNEEIVMSCSMWRNAVSKHVWRMLLNVHDNLLAVLYDFCLKVGLLRFVLFSSTATVLFSLVHHCVYQNWPDMGQHFQNPRLKILEMKVFKGRPTKSDNSIFTKYSNLKL